MVRFVVILAMFFTLTAEAQAGTTVYCSVLSNFAKTTAIKKRNGMSKKAFADLLLLKSLEQSITYDSYSMLSNVSQSVFDSDLGAYTPEEIKAMYFKVCNELAE